MAATGRIQRRLALAIVLTALIPVLMAIWLAETTVRQTAARFFMPDIGTHLDRSLDVYQEYARTVKALMNQEATAIALRPGLAKAALEGDAAATAAELKAAFAEHPSLVTLSARDPSGRTLASVSRQQPLDPERENKLEVRHSFGAAPASEDDEDEVTELVAVFAANKARFDQRDEMSQFLDAYKEVERRRESDEKSYVLAFALLLGITIVAAIGVGTLLARGVSRRIAGLARATQLVAAGDLRIRVAEKGGDEIADLARAFNSMLAEVELSRSRLEYLQRISAWQEMARRLAHEIKNPLTPIQLAVQEIHRRSAGADPEYKRLVDTTLEIVEDEVGTLRRLVSEFSDFARLPQAKLESADLVEFLREQRQQLEVGDDEQKDSGDGAEDLRAIWQADVPIDLEWQLPDGRAEVLMDRHMLRRVLINLLRNAAQAVSQHAGKQRGKIRVELGRHGEYWDLDIDDTGPGIVAELRDTAFDPYVTTKTDGTGLGLAIVKKIVIEHGGTVVADDSPLGGARLRVRLPAQGTRAARAALEMRDQKPPASTRRGAVSAA
jgi:nitrogen fixation/metabolism regulation signal transduction histidine kinase